MWQQNKQHNYVHRIQHKCSFVFFFLIILEELTLKVSKQAATRNNLVLSLRAHGRLPWLPLTVRSFHGCHSPYGASMPAYHQPHYSSYRTLHYPTQQPPHHLEFLSATEDCLEAALAKLDAATRRLDARLDALLLRLPWRPDHHYPPQFPCSAPITPSFTPLLPLL